MVMPAGMNLKVSLLQMMVDVLQQAIQNLLNQNTAI